MNKKQFDDAMEIAFQKGYIKALKDVENDLYLIFLGYCKESSKKFEAIKKFKSYFEQLKKEAGE